ncbi:MAG: lysylphosphatidylglycerol synthase domain-containing protein [Geminicoccaceae bacterium]
MKLKAPIADLASLEQPHGASGWRARLRVLVPYLVGAIMFAVAVWVLHRTLGRFHLGDLQSEIANLSLHQLILAILFSFASFMCLIGYEWSALGVIGRRLPLPQLSLASFTTQSICHSTGFAFLIGATLRYNFYVDKGLSIAEVAMVQVLFTLTFTLGVGTLAGTVVVIEPWRLAAATGIPADLWRLAAATALLLVAAYVVWGAFFHRPVRWRGREFVLPSAGATLTQIFFGVTDLLAVAAALWMLVPADLGLTYPEVLTIFMAALMVGLMSHVPGSLGVFESAVILLVQPSEAQTLPLIGALLAFRGIYYLLPLVCGVTLLALREMHRWRGVIAQLGDRVRLDLGPGTPQVAATLSFAAGLALLLAAMMTGGVEVDPAAPLQEAARIFQVAMGVALLMLARGLSMRLANAWRWVMAFLLLAVPICVLAREWAALDLGLLVLAFGLFACRANFSQADGRLPDSP